MGVPAFYRWLSEKYPKIVQDVLEERVQLAPCSTSIRLPFDATRPNPSGVECDNLFIDMNGIIHPCSHPEIGPQPASEEEMYENVCKYVDRLFRAFRPRKLLYLAIDGVAPRAKMNQQRSRRFRSAQEARELVELEAHVRTELQKSGQRVPPAKAAWDSNVITPGTTFMINLATYIRFYIRKRISTDKAWKDIRVIFSDASLPGEGEHKIMSHIRLQRSQPGYNPNLVHVLHGLDADLIMLALATHEAHFYISREEVLFGRKSQEQQEQRQLESGFRDTQRAFDEQAGAEAMQLTENLQKPMHRISIPILREYLASEFSCCITPGRVPFEPSFERLLDDIVFLCFFVGNDFLPHLPSLDIRDGALDYLFNVYKRLLPSLGDYMTKSGGNVNLSHVDVLLAEVGAIEDHVFAMKYENEERERRRREEMNGRKKQGQNPHAPPPVLHAHVEQPMVRGRAAKILEKREKEEAIALSRRQSANDTLKVSHRKTEENAAAALALKESLGRASVTNEEVTKGSKRPLDVMDKAKTENGEVIIENSVDGRTEMRDEAVDIALEKEPGVVGDAEDEFDADVDEDEDLDAELPEVEDIDEIVDPEAAKVFKERVKAEQQNKLEVHAKMVEDKVRLHEAGWKDRYYTDKCKADDVKNHGGREHLFRSYVVGLCWVMKYYYDGCPSWKWYYPFHYGPFASDLKNIERFEKDCKSFELNTPFNPVEQLMAVLPSDSSHAIPHASRWLMQDPESPIIDFYPMDVPVDPNGKAMPWLWVVLLPFIDEDRLLSALSPTMTKWTKTELLCNARGLDDGYLYVHRNNSLSKKLKVVLQGGKTANTQKTKLIDAAAYGCPGFTGSLRPPLHNELYPTNEDTVVPQPPGADRIDGSVGVSIFSESIDPNDAVCVAFTEPPKLSHKSILLLGAQPAPPTLTDDDKRIRRPRLNRGGGSIANMGTTNGQSFKSGFGSMNVGSYERNLAQNNGRGNDMYQTGNRAWGAMEPVPKRRNIPSQMPNPFMNEQGCRNLVSNQPQNWQNQDQWGGAQHQNLPYQGPPRHAPHQHYQQGYQNQNPPPYQGQMHHGNQHQPPPYHAAPYQGSQQHGYQQRPSPHRGNVHQAYPSNNRGGGVYSQPTQPQNYNTNYNHQGPPPQQPGIDFRSYNQGPIPNQQQRGHGSQQNNERRSRASADVMSSLRAQLTSTLNQKRGPGGPSNPR